MCNPSDIIAYHCPRWEELPDIELYMDQVVGVLEKHLAPFTESDGGRLITSTMINNYVKHGVISPPVNKRYGREHLAALYIVCVLKRFMSIPEISTVIRVLVEKYTLRDAYNRFCFEFEDSLREAFAGAEDMEAVNAETAGLEPSLIKSTTSAYSNILFARHLINITQSKTGKPAAAKKAERAEKKNREK